MSLKQHKYTVFCADEDRASTWIGTVEATDANKAVEKAREDCAGDWDTVESEVIVVGVIKGEPDIILWEDLGIQSGDIEVKEG